MARPLLLRIRNREYASFGEEFFGRVNMKRKIRLRSAMVVVAAAVVPVVNQAARATDFFWNAPNGGTGTWDTATQMWSSTSAGPVDHIWANDGTERANFANTVGTVTINSGITTAGIAVTTSN